jgi:hypothetical protein
MLLTLLLGVAACASGPGPGPDGGVSLDQVPWCDQPSINFQDDGKLTRPMVSDWKSVKGQLGFTPYLPASLPKGSCLALAGGSIHDPVFGGRFLITYYLPKTGPLSFSEAPKSASGSNALSDKVQCSQAGQGATPSATASGTPGAAGSGTPTATAAPALTVCLGTISGTNVSVASAQSPADLEAMFKALQPNVEWVPQQPATPTASATTKP